MAQKINPISLRLQFNNRYFDNSWYSKKYYDQLITRDILIQKYINTFLKLLKLPLGRFSIQHLPKKTRLFSFFCYPKISRDSRSKMFGVYSPTFFRNKKFFRKNKWTTNKLSSKFSNWNEKNTKSTSKLMNYGTNKLKFLYNKNLWFSFNWNKTHKNLLWINQLFENKKYTLNNIYIINLYKKNYPNLKTKFFDNSNIKLKTDNIFFTKNPVLSYQKNKFEITNTNIKIKKNSNDLFLRFFLNLIIFNQRKLEKKKGKKNQNFISSNKDLFLKKNNSKKINKIKPLNLFKIFLILNKCSKNIYRFNKIFSHSVNNFTLFDIKLVDYLNRKNSNSIKNKWISHSKIIKKNNKNIFQNNISLKNDFYSQMFNFGSPKNILETQLDNIYYPNRNQNNQFLLLSSKWKLNNIENKYKYKNYIQRSLASIFNLNFEFIPIKVNHDWQSAGFLADEIVYFLERRVPFRRIKNKILKQLAKNSNIRGVRITCSGRVGGKSKKAQRAKTECVKLGQTSLHVFSSQIDFAVRTAQTSFGSVGIKVWICYN